jgi:hypothetical protein
MFFIFVLLHGENICCCKFAVSTEPPGTEFGLDLILNQYKAPCEMYVKDNNHRQNTDYNPNENAHSLCCAPSVFSSHNLEI